MPPLQAAITAEVKRLEAMPSAEQQFRACQAAAAALTAAQAAVALVKRSAVRRQIEQGYTLRELSDLYGLSRARISEIAGN